MIPAGARAGTGLYVDPARQLGSPTSASMATSPTGSLLAAPFVSPDPAYIAAKEAAFIITKEVLVEFHHADEVELTQMHDTSLSQISASAMSNVNAFLDRILLNILSNARSLSLVSLRPAVRDVLRPKLAQEAIAGADEELIECIGEEDENIFFEDGQEGQDSSWDLETAWKRARLRCMVYTRLGDMEEEDEERYIEESGLDDYTDGRRLSRGNSMVSPPVAIWLTAILEFIGENVLMSASHAAYKRCEGKYGRGIAGQALHPSVVLVGDNDLEKIALSPTLGRLWRAWRKPIRSPKNSISRTLSIDSIRHRKADSRSAPGLTRKASSETLSSIKPEPGSKRASVDKEASVEAGTEAEAEAEPEVEIDPATLPLPITDHDVDEIEVPGFNPTLRRSARPTSIPLNNVTAITQAFQRLVQGGSRRMRANSLETTKWDLVFPEAEQIEIGPLFYLDVPKSVDPVPTAEQRPSRPLSANDDVKATSRTSSEMRKARDVSNVQDKSSSISQRRRSKRLSYQSAGDRKSGVSEYGGPGGPVLFSRSDYRVSHHEASAVPEVPVPPEDLPAFNTKVIVPTPTAETMTIPPQPEVRSSNRLSAPGPHYAVGAYEDSDDDAEVLPGEVSPVEVSEDEGSAQIVGLKDAQEHHGVVNRKPSRRARPVSMDRPVSPLVDDPHLHSYEDYHDNGPVSPLSPDMSRESGWLGTDDFDVSPVTERRRSAMVPPANTAPAAASVPAVASGSTAGMVGAAAIAAAAAGIASSTQNRPLQQAEGRDSGERRREAEFVSPRLSDGRDKEMPQIPREAQQDMLYAAAANHQDFRIPQPDTILKSIHQNNVPQSGDVSSYPGRPTYEPVSEQAPLAKTSQLSSGAQRSNAPQMSNAPQIPPKSTSQKSNTPQMPSKVTPQRSNAPQFTRKEAPARSVTPPKENAPQIPPKSPTRQREAMVYSNSIISDPVITSVMPVPSRSTAFPTSVPIPSDSIITSVGPAPAPQTLVQTNNMPGHRRELSEEAKSPLGQGITPLHLPRNSALESNPPTSKLLERRRNLPQVDTVDPERSGVQRLTPSPTSANDATKQFPPRSIPETVQSAMAPVPAVKRKPASRNQSKSGEEVFYGGYREQQAPDAEKAREFNQLINSDQTIQFTLTPQNIRSYQTTDPASDLQVKAQSMERNRSHSASNSILGKVISSTKQKGFPIKIPENAIRSNSRLSTVGKSGMVPREAKTTATESLREMAAFFAGTGPNEAPEATASAARTGKRGPQPIPSQDIIAKPTSVSMPTGTRSPPNSQGPRRVGPRLVARDPQASSSGVSDLVDFLRDSSMAAPNGNTRMTREASYGGGSVNSTQESFKTNSVVSSSVNSHTGLLSGGRGSGGGGGGYMSGGFSDEPQMPVRKSRKPVDMYAIPGDDDDTIDEMDEDGGANEESLADFLNSQAARAPRQHQQAPPPPPPAAANNSRSGNPQRVSSIGRPIGPGGIPSRASLRAPSSGVSDIADFFKNTPPPPPSGPISRIPEEEPKRGGFGKVFGGRKQRT